MRRRGISLGAGFLALWCAVALAAEAPRTSSDLIDRFGREHLVKVHLGALQAAGEAGVVVLEVLDTDAAVMLWIGRFEAQAIGMALHGIEVPRPMTHDLLNNTLRVLGVEVEKVVVVDLRANIYHAYISLRTQEGEKLMDARPSDAIALALRSGSPVYISDAALSKATKMPLADGLEQALVERAWGLKVQELTSDLIRLFSLGEEVEGVLVAEVAPDSPASRSRLRRGDVIITVGGKKVTRPDELFAAAPRGGTVELSILRGGRRENLQIQY